MSVRPVRRSWLAALRFRCAGGREPGRGRKTALGTYAIGLESYQAVLEDRAMVIAMNDAWIVAVADGAGGIRHGDRAAEYVVQEVDTRIKTGSFPHNERAWANLLGDVDVAISQATDTGQTTVVVLTVTSERIYGASVGDSEAWLIGAAGHVNLTDRQRRKPFLGSGIAEPVPFGHANPGGVLLVATDGLFKYAQAPQIREVASQGAAEEACRALIDLIRLPTGKLKDDVGVVVCRLSPDPFTTIPT